MDLIVAIAATITLLIAAIAIVVLFNSWRRVHFRFGTRTMLLTCAFVAGTLFLILRFVSPLIAHRWAVQQIYNSGSTILFRKDVDRVDSGTNFFGDRNKDNP